MVKRKRRVASGRREKCALFGPSEEINCYI